MVISDKVLVDTTIKKIPVNLQEKAYPIRNITYEEQMSFKNKNTNK